MLDMDQWRRSATRRISFNQHVIDDNRLLTFSKSESVVSKLRFLTNNVNISGSMADDDDSSSVAFSSANDSV